jgi:hypothetical protein
VRSKVDHCIYSKGEGEHFIYVASYVDDLLLIGNNMDTIKEVKKQLSSNFDIKYISVAKVILGMDIKRYLDARKLWLNQTKYIETTLKRFNMKD